MKYLLLAFGLLISSAINASSISARFFEVTLVNATQNITMSFKQVSGLDSGANNVEMVSQNPSGRPIYKLPNSKPSLITFKNGIANTADISYIFPLDPFDTARSPYLMTIRLIDSAGVTITSWRVTGARTHSKMFDGQNIGNESLVSSLEFSYESLQAIAPNFN